MCCGKVRVDLVWCGQLCLGLVWCVCVLTWCRWTGCGVAWSRPSPLVMFSFSKNKKHHLSRQNSIHSRQYNSFLPERFPHCCFLVSLQICHAGKPYVSAEY